MSNTDVERLLREAYRARAELLDPSALGPALDFSTTPPESVLPTTAGGRVSHRHTWRLSLVAAVIALLAASVVAVIIFPRDRNDSATSGTRVVYAAPVDFLGHPVGLPIAATVSGECQLSGVTLTVEVYWCYAEGADYDPCWPDSDGGLLCLSAPWATSVTRIVTPGITRSGAVATTDFDWPWGVELTSGAQCIGLRTGRDSFGSQTIEYDCTGGPTPGLQLLHSLDRTTHQWTYQTVIRHGRDLVAGPMVTVTSAWFAGPAPIKAPECATSALTVHLYGRGTILAFVNNTSAPCRLRGYPQVAFIDNTGHEAIHAGHASARQWPVLDVVIPPGGSAYARLQPARDFMLRSCPAFKSLVVTPPGGGTSTTLSAPNAALCAGTTIRPVTVSGR
jgi:Protein of unknown function (DUF4232)